MAKLYANENFPLATVTELRARGHDVVTTHEAGHANKGTPDEEVLDFATANGWAVLTHNRRDFRQLHKDRVAAGRKHAGIVNCTQDEDFVRLAHRIDAAVKEQGEELAGKLVSVFRPA